MHRKLALLLTMWLGLAGPVSSAGIRCCFFGERIVVPPPPPAPLPDDPCAHRLHLCHAGAADKWLEQLLSAPDKCARKVAAQMLGCRLLADYCQNPEVLRALIVALQCDASWEVRYNAAWSIHRQNARTDESVVALYVASRLDPHYQVRYRANEALDLLLVLHRVNYKDLLAQAEKLVPELQGKYKPGSLACRQAFQLEAAPVLPEATRAQLLPPVQ